MKLAQTSTRKSYDHQLLEQLLVAPMDQTEPMRQTDNSTNTQSFYGNVIQSEQHELEINDTLRISDLYLHLKEIWLTITLYFKDRFFQFFKINIFQLCLKFT